MLTIAEGPPSVPRASAAVVLLRPRPGAGGALEVFLLRRHRKASFMSSAFVFPGGIAEPGDGDPRVTAARELFEEAGVLLADRSVADAERAAWRTAVLDGAPLAAVLAGAGVGLDVDPLLPLSRWITPSAEPRRYDARFFVARAPDGQEPSFDARETVDQAWVTPSEALARAAELHLPPPQLYTLGDLAAACEAGWDAIRVALAGRAADRPILPRLAAEGGGFALYLPWDDDYGAGPGELVAWDGARPSGPSRITWDGAVWRTN